MKKAVQFIFALALGVALIAPMTAFAAVGTVFTVANGDGINITYRVLTESDDAGTVQVGNGIARAVAQNVTSVAIPASVENGGTNYAVTSIGDRAFSYCYDLQSITLPDSVTSIGERVFASCSNLKSVSIGAGVTSIGIEAFYGCTSLQSITLPAGVTSIGDWAFCACKNMQSISIPASVTSIGTYAFCACEKLESITIPRGVTSIGRSVFDGCYSLHSITLPDSVTFIGMYAFYDCGNLKSITIPASVTSIGLYAFYCSGLTEVFFDGDAPLTAWNAFTYYDASTYTDNVYLNAIAYVYRDAEGFPTEGWKWNGLIVQYRDDVQPVCEHDETYEVETLPATCTKTGLKNVYCYICNALLETDVVIDALGHDYEAVVTEPTCTQDGYTTYTCQDCGDSFNDDFVAAEHDWVHPYTEPTCTDDGFWTTECALCGEDGNWLMVDHGSKLGHDWVIDEENSHLVCGEEWICAEYCERCGDTQTTVGDEDDLYVCGETNCPLCNPITGQTNAEFLMALIASGGANDLSGNLVMRGGVVTLVFGDREIALKGANNFNISGELELEDGFVLVYDLKGNGKNVKTFQVVQK